MSTFNLNNLNTTVNELPADMVKAQEIIDTAIEVGLNEMLMDYSDNISKFVKDVNDFGFDDYEDLEREDIYAVLSYATRLSQIKRIETNIAA
jgi:hypothetical protein